MNPITAACAVGALAGKRHPGLGTTILLCAAAYAAAAQAGAAQEESWPQVWLNPGIYSQHFDSSKGLRNNNIGFGAEARLASDHVVMAGSFINSNRARTHFAGYEWRPLHWRFSGVDVGAGIVVGAFDGYPNYRNGAWFVAPLPMLSVEGKTLGANIALIPTVANRFDGALAVQLKLRVW
ncbi:MAG: hypothetical protein WC830_13240 [Burkholderiales bacterium]